MQYVYVNVIDLFVVLFIFLMEVMFMCICILILYLLMLFLAFECCPSVQFVSVQRVIYLLLMYIYMFCLYN